MPNSTLGDIQGGWRYAKGKTGPKVAVVKRWQVDGKGKAGWREVWACQHEHKAGEKVNACAESAAMLAELTAAS